MKSTFYRFTVKSASVVLTCLAAGLVLSAGAQQPANNEEFARRQYDSGMSFLQNHRYAEALKDLQAVVDSFGASTVAPGALLAPPADGAAWVGASVGTMLASLSAM